MIKKIIAMLLAALMLASLFTGCSGNSGSSATTGAATKAASTTKAATTPTAPSKGTELMNPLGALPLVSEPYTFTVGVRNANYIDLKTNVLWNYAQEQTGLTFEAVELPADEYATKLDLMMAAGGDDLPEILMGDAVSNDVRNTWGSAGFLVDINPYWDDNTYYIPQIWADKMKSVDLDTAKNLICASDGGLYGVPGIVEGLTQAINGRIYWYTPWLEKAGMYNIDENGEFMTTLDEMVTYLKLVRDGDYNENGINDEIPLTGGNQWFIQCGFLSAFLMNNGGDFYYDKATDKVTYNYTRPEYKEALQFINMLVEEKLLDPLAFTQDETSCMATVIADKLRVGGIIRRNSNGGLTTDTVPAKTDFDYSTALLPTGYTQRNTYWSKAAPASTYLITQNCKNVPLAIRFADWAATTTINQAYGFDGNEYISYENLKNPSEYVNLFGKPVEECFYSVPSLEEGNRKMDKSGDNVCFVWHFPYLFSMDLHSNVLIKKDLVTPLDESHAKKTLLYSSMMDQDAILGTMKWTAEETAINQDVYTPISTYSDESFTRFCLGDLDIDTDWDAYVEELNNMGIQQVIDNYNACYDRTYR